MVSGPCAKNSESELSLSLSLSLFPRETIGRAVRPSTAHMLWIVVMLAEARTAGHPRKGLVRQPLCIFFG